MNVADNKLIKPTDKEINEDVIKHLEKKMKPAFSFLVSCSSRRRVLNPSSYAKEIKGVSKSSGGPLFGFCSFGEIGSKPAEACHFHHLCNNVFNVYNKLLSK